MDVFETIKKRRSIRKYEDRDVENNKVREVIKAAILAPSWANTQCWRFIVIRDEEIKEELSETLTESNPAKEALSQAPVLIVGCAKKNLSGYSDGDPFDEKDWAMFDTGLAMQNLMLAARALGLGTVPIGAFDNEKVRNILNVPEDIEVTVMTPLGYPDNNPESSRENIDNFIIENKF